MATEAGKADSGLKLFGPEMVSDPYPVYHRLRATHPVFWVTHLDAWVVTSYEAVSVGLRNLQLSSDRIGRIQQRLAAKGLDVLIDKRVVSMLHKDAPNHSRLRGLVNMAFTPRAVGATDHNEQLNSSSS